MSFTQNVLLWALVFMLIGASFFITDRKIGVKIYSKISKWWHPPSTATGVPAIERGFIYNRSNATRWKIAGLISAFQAAIMIGFRHEDPRIELMLFIVITPSTYVGFLLGPYYEKFKKMREKGFEKLDQIESGKLDVGHELHEALEKKKKAAGEAVGKTADRAVSFFSEFIPSFSKKNAPEVPPAPDAPVGPDPAEEAAARAREKIKELTKGKRS